MKKRTLFAVIAIVVVIAACVKEKKNIIPQSGNDKNPDDTTVVVKPPTDTTKVDTPKVADNNITVTGIEDITVNMYGIAILNLNIKCDSCKGNELFLSVEGLNNPKIETEITKESGFSDFNSELVVKSYFAKAGSYEMVLKASDRQGKDVSYKKKIKIDEPAKSDCNKYFIDATDNARFDEIRHMSNATLNGTINIDTLLPANWYIPIYYNEQEANIYLKYVLLGWSQTLQNYFFSYKSTSDYHLLINYNCLTGKLDIPEQIIEGRDGGQSVYVTVTGSGELNMTNKTFEIEYLCKFKDGNTTVYQTFKLIDKLKKL